MALGQRMGMAGPYPAVIAAGLCLASFPARRLRLPGLAQGLMMGAALWVGLARGAEARAGLTPVNPFNETGRHQVRCAVVSDPEVSGLWARFVCLPREVDGRPMNARDGIRITTRASHRLQYGDLIVASLELETAPEAGGFDYRGYLGRQGISAIAFVDGLDEVTRGGWTPQRALFSFRRAVLAGVARTVPEPEAGFLSGILLGATDHLPDSVREDLRRAGLLHVLVVSGFNLVLIVSFVTPLLRRAGGWAMACLGAAGLCLFYVALTGGDPPVLRAGIMVLLALGARLVGRPAHAWTGLGVAATAMALHRPALLLEPSYQLSVATTAGMLWMSGRRLSLPAGLARLSPMAEALGTTIAAQAAALPVLAVHFGEVPGLGLLANGVVLPLQAPQMLGAGIAAASGALPQPVAVIVALPAWLLARATLGVAHVVAQLPGAVIAVGHWGSAATLAYALVLLALVNRPPGGSLRTLVAAGASRLRVALSPLGVLAVGVVAVWVVALQLPDGRLHLAFLDVGQGDALLVTSPGGRRILIDGGRDPDVLLAYLGRALPVWQRRLDVVVLTHPDLDHMGGLLGLSEGYRVGLLIASAAPVPEAWAEEWRGLEAAADQVRVPAARESVLVGDGLSVRVLHPLASGCPTWSEGDNDCSTVLELVYGEARVLLMADAETAVENYLVGSRGLSPTWLLKVSHHGSAHATGEGFLEGVHPSLAVISVGENRYGHPSAAVLERLDEHEVERFRTDQLGTVEFVTDGERYVVNTGR